jgi:hypothetical protein
MNKNFKINYLAKDFSTIKKELKDYAARFYPDTLSDASEASITSFIIDSMAYVGDSLSYFIDYQSNESFLATAMERKNILALATELGYKRSNTTSTTGIVSIYMLMPAGSDGKPDFSQAPVIKRGTSFSSADGTKTFLTTEDIIIDENQTGKQYVIARTNEVKNPTYYAVKLSVPVISGEISTFEKQIGSFIPFNKVYLPDLSIVEIASVLDSDGNEYYEVPNLSQNVVYQSIPLTEPTSELKSLLRTVSAQRRFVFGFDGTLPYIMFGGKQYKQDDDLTVDVVTEPSKFVLERYNTDYTTEEVFEPNRLINGDRFGIGPDNTKLTITYRKNKSYNNNAEVGEVVVVKSLNYVFNNTSVTNDTINTIINSIQIINEEPIIGDSLDIDIEEIKDLAGSIFQTQNRAVTAKDYETLAYMLPSKYGTIGRAKAVRDANSPKNNINLYIACKDTAGHMIQSNTRIKENLKFWLSGYKMLTDTVDILDAKVVNLGLSFTIMVDPNFDKANVLDAVSRQLEFRYRIPAQIGEPFNILDVYREIRKINGVLDIKDRIKVNNLTSLGYSSVSLDIERNRSADGNYIIMPKNAIWEIKNARIGQDIIGKTI